MTKEANATGRLTREDIQQYACDGYTLFRQPVFAPQRFERLKAIFEENLAEYGAANLDMPHTRDERLLEFLLAPEVLDLVEPLTGPNIGLWASHFISKEPRTGKATPWHEDSAYWMGRISDMAGICTVWLALDPVFPENGSMGVMPGTHTNGFSEYEKEGAEAHFAGFERRIRPEAIDETKAVFFTLEPNQASLHEARIVHGARANTSNVRRAGYTMRYFPTTARIIPEKNPGHRLWLARGVDLAGNTYQNARRAVRPDPD
ncbi:phytanoyl-CoA dioxygenase family protein [Deinococcus sonorensis]|uniref:Phytanoyl-CoA dioxygenase family protein n=2 Tax=Deinococcus sonorensis TaxID=309891 RepID=A0AAU7U6D5_9DEIO